MKKTAALKTPSAALHKALDKPQLDAVAQLFGVLSEVSRLQILQILQSGDKSVGDLVEKLNFKQANASKQLGILLAAGVIDRRQDGNRAIYSIKLPMVFELCELVCRGVADQAADKAKALRR